MHIIRKLKSFLKADHSFKIIRKPNYNLLKYKKQQSKFTVQKLGKKNPNKIFYIISRTPGAGLFSNVIFVLHHLDIAEKKKFIPVVDMQNFPNFYNEAQKIENTFNSWNYYFDPVSKYKLKDIYKSKKVVFAHNKITKKYNYSVCEKKKFLNLFKKYIKVRKKHLLKINKIRKDYFNINKKIVGIHFRGTSFKTSAGHTFPATLKQIKNVINKLIEKKYEKIFLCTEEKKYFDILNKVYKNKVLFLNTYRSNTNNAFKIYPRKNHRYRLGKEILFETILLSNCDMFVYIQSNVSEFVKMFNVNKNQKRICINNGFNSKNEYIASWLWYFKKSLPSFLGGFNTFEKFKFD